MTEAWDLGYPLVFLTQEGAPLTLVSAEVKPFVDLVLAAWKAVVPLAPQQWEVHCSQDIQLEAVHTAWWVVPDTPAGADQEAGILV